MTVRRAKPYVCVDCDFADHPRFLNARDLDMCAGAWLRCLAYTRAQELDGVVSQAWVKRAFAKRMRRIDDLVSVGLLRVREDGDYEVHAYAPRNQTKAMLAEARKDRRERLGRWRQRRDLELVPSSPSDSGPTRDSNRFDARPKRDLVAAKNESCLDPASPSFEGDEEVLLSESPKRENHIDAVAGAPTSSDGPSETGLKRVTGAFPSTSSSLSSSSSTSLFLNTDKDPEIQSSPEARDSKGGVQRGEPAARESEVGGEPQRHPLPRSERALAGPAWLAAFTEGITAATGRTCTWLREQAQAFGTKWDGKFPPKGLTPDGLERWLNEGRGGPPVFGKPRTLQLPASEWTPDDFSDLGAVVISQTTDSLGKGNSHES